MSKTIRCVFNFQRAQHIQFLLSPHRNQLILALGIFGRHARQTVSKYTKHSSQINGLITFLLQLSFNETAYFLHNQINRVAQNRRRTNVVLFGNCFHLGTDLSVSAFITARNILFLFEFFFSLFLRKKSLADFSSNPTKRNTPPEAISKDAKCAVCLVREQSYVVVEWVGFCHRS